MNAAVAAKAETFDCRQAFAETLIELARRRSAHRRRLQRQRRFEQSCRQFQKTVPRPPDQCRHRRAGHGRRGCGPRQRRIHAFRLRRRAVPDRARAGADQGRRRLQRLSSRAVRHEPRNGLWRTRADASFDRGPELAPRDRRARDRRAGRSGADARRGALGGESGDPRLSADRTDEGALRHRRRHRTPSRSDSAERAARRARR